VIRRWDCVVVGGGPAGLSAAIYMGRFRRSTLVLDDVQGRWTYGQRTENYLGFPRGVGARELVALGRSQAARFGASFETTHVGRVERDAHGFRLETSAGVRRARTVIWAAGVRDLWPDLPGARALVGRRLFWCIVCDGWRVRGKRVLVVGGSLRDARTALQFLSYTQRVTFLVEPGRRLLARARRRLEASAIRIRAGSLERLRVRDDGLDATIDGARLRTDYVFSLLGCVPRTEPLEDLKLAYSKSGNLCVDALGATRVPGFFAAGDVNDQHSHQVSAAVHEGAAAAQAANFMLYPARQRLLSR
jgi:thioredoxin reductase (NADPH)